LSRVPSPELEAARDLVRAREDAAWDRMRDRHQLSKFRLRHGRLVPGSVRGRSSGASGFPSSGSSSPPSSSPSIPNLHTVDLVDRRIEALECAIRGTAEAPRSAT